MTPEELELPGAKAPLIRLFRNSDFQAALTGLMLCGALAWEPLFWVALAVGAAVLIFGGEA